MFIVISDNCESYSDHTHQTVLVCQTEDEAKEAVLLIREWMGEASQFIASEWDRYRDVLSRESQHEGDGYCLTWDGYKKRKPLPIDICTGCFPYRTDRIADERDLEDAIDYMEVPLWAKDTK
jgi:hypothetical protein